MLGKRIFVKLGGEFPLIPYMCYAVDNGYEYYVCLTEDRPKLRVSLNCEKTIINIPLR